MVQTMIISSLNSDDFNVSQLIDKVEEGVVLYSSAKTGTK